MAERGEARPATLRPDMPFDDLRQKAFGETLRQPTTRHRLVHRQKPAAVLGALRVEKRPTGVAARKMQVERPPAASRKRLVKRIFHERTYFNAVHVSVTTPFL